MYFTTYLHERDNLFYLEDFGVAAATESFREATSARLDAEIASSILREGIYNLK